MHLIYWNAFVATSGGYSDRWNRWQAAGVGVNMTIAFFLIVVFPQNFNKLRTLSERQLFSKLVVMLNDWFSADQVTPVKMSYY